MSLLPFDTPWHPSEQPDIIRDKELRRRVRAGAWKDWALTGLTALISAPQILWQYSFPKRVVAPTWQDFLGISISPHAQGQNLVTELVQELGVKNLLVRLPIGTDCSDRLDLLRTLPKHDFLVVLQQDRALVCNQSLWMEKIREIVPLLPQNVRAIQIGLGTNRLKWGFATTREYLDFLTPSVDLIRKLKPQCTILGSSVLDFEPLATIRSLINGYNFHLDALASLLYIDRRGGPHNVQYGFFNLARKIRLLSAILHSSRHADKHLWITEFNWPLKGTKPFAPTSEAECVDEEIAAQHIGEYLQIARESGLCERAYYWQLIHPGFGLVDDRTGIRKRPAFAVVQKLLG